MKFYPADWRSDAMLRLCSISARGLWAEMMCLMHEAERYGSLLINGRRIDKKQLAGLAGISEKECIALLLELEGNGVFSRDEDGTIYSRRMRRDFEKAEENRATGALGGAPDLVGGLPKSERQNRFSRKDNPTKVEAVWAASGGKCAACDCEMQRDRANAPDAFTVDHIIALAQGGSNDLANLQALCRACNRRKGITPTDEKSAGGVKAQRLEARNQKGSEASASGADAPIDHRKRLFDEGLPKLAKLTGKGPDACRSFVGKCLKAAGDDAIVVLGLIEDAERNQVADPSAWIAARLKSPESGNGKQKSAVIQAIDDLNQRIAGFDGPARGPDELRRVPGQNSPRLLSHG